MNIKDIVNRDIINLTNCESEPIHIPGSIQPFGFLLGIKTQNQVIEYCSANCSEFIQLTPEMLLGKTLSDIFSKKECDEFYSYSTENSTDIAKPFVFTFNEIKYNTSVHQSSGILILELEPFPDGTLDLPNLYTQTRSFVSLLEKNNYLVDLCNDIAIETRRITGYDRVMIYQFDAEYNGEVIAESKRDDLNSFSGQKYPHTDIPQQARELYIRNLLRIIVDINYQPVPLMTLNSDEKSNKSLDLSLSILRSVSPIHIEYLKNMGVGATLTISLLQNNKLWGLIACHHYSPKILPHYTRLSALLQGHFLTSQITVREVSEEFEIGQKVDKALLESLTLLHENDDFIEKHYQSASLLELANATGFVIYYGGQLYKNGNVPDDEDIIPLLKWLAEKYPNDSESTNQLVNIYPLSEKFAKHAAGIIYHSITAGTSDGIIWLRSERKETISWAGNPHKAVVINEGGAMPLSPRKSFGLWLEEVKNKSTEWRKSELNTSSSFAYALQKFTNLRYVKSQEIKSRLLNDELKAANKELANLNWISTHDLKEPLRKIQIFASKVLDIENPDLSAQVKDSVERMRFAAEKMQLLIDDILTYSKTSNMEKVFETIDLNDILQNVLEEIGDSIEEKKALITFDKLPALEGIPFQIHQLFVNLISNALKFSKDNVVLSINIEMKNVDSREISQEVPSDKLFRAGSIRTGLKYYYAISFQDNGIGFEKEYRNRIFDVFQRLNPAHKYPGTGIGLSICKKIMENHKGYILADSKFGEGSRFTVYFPQPN